MSNSMGRMGQIGRMVSCAFCAIAGCGDLWAADSTAYVETGRYTEVATSATAAQVDPLSALITTTIPVEMATVSQGMEYVLQRSGWRLAPIWEADEQTQILYALPLPTVHRRMGPISLRDALETLAGKPFVMVEDPARRSLAFTYPANTEKKTAKLEKLEKLEKRKNSWGG